MILQVEKTFRNPSCVYTRAVSYVYICRGTTFVRIRLTNERELSCTKTRILSQPHDECVCEASGCTEGQDAFASICCVSTLAYTNRRQNEIYLKQKSTRR